MIPFLGEITHNVYKTSMLLFFVFAIFVVGAHFVGKSGRQVLKFEAGRYDSINHFQANEA